MSDPVVAQGAGWAVGPVTVAAPATSANLGPGYDCLGLALELHDTLVGEVVDRGLVVEVQGEGADGVPRDETHLVVRAMQAYFEAADVRPPGLRLHCTNRIPHSRGLGSSSAAIVGGLVLARGLVRPAAGATDDGPDLLGLANRLEGHPDNVAPALVGGFVVAGQQGEDVWAHRVAVSGRAVLAVPPQRVSTELARGLLPATVPHAEAAANTGRAALLTALLAGTGGPPDAGALLRATEDFLHQAYREPAMPESLALVERLRAARLPAVVSGAGPSVLVLLGDDAVAAGELVRRLAPSGWQVLEQAVGGPGARVLA